MSFKAWLESQGCTVEVTQEDDGSGYICLEVITPDHARHDVTVSNS
jgi:hypothetical protein